MTTYKDEDIIGVYSSLVSPDALTRYDKTAGWLAKYNGGLVDRAYAQKYLNSFRNTVCARSGSLAGKSVLDVGCGFGIPCVTMAMLGAKSVHGVDAFDKMIDTIAAYLPDVPVGDRVNARVGSAFNLPYDDGTFDVALMFEALSHFLHPQKCVEEGVRVLKPGGWLIIADDNNGANPKLVNANAEVWRRFEFGPVTGPGETVHGHQVLEAYVSKRARLIDQVAPGLSQADRDRLVDETCYMVRSDVERAAREFVESGRWPGSRFRPDRCPVEPETGQYIENLLHPLDYARQLEELGCEVEIEAYFGGHGREGVVRTVNDMANRLLPVRRLVRISPGFRLYARKA